MSAPLSARSFSPSAKNCPALNRASRPEKRHTVRSQNKRKLDLCEELWYARSRKSWEVARMAEQGYDLMHKDDVVASLQLDDLSGAILKVTPGTNPELLPLGGRLGADSLRKWWLRRAVPISQGGIAAFLQRERISTTQSLLVRNLGLSLSDHY